MIKWNRTQKKAITLKNKNILISASAGSGKTAVMIARIRRLVVEEQTPISKILCVTFTRAAADELKSRLRFMLSEAIENEEGDKAFLEDQLADLNDAYITTIDAFCNKLTKAHYPIVGIDPNYRIGDTAELDLLNQEVLDEVLEIYYQNSIMEDTPDDFAKLVEMITENRNDLRLRKYIVDFYNFFMTLPDYESWMQKAISNFNSDKLSKVWEKTLLDQVHVQLEDALSLMNEALLVARNGEGFEKTCSLLESEKAKIEELLLLASVKETVEMTSTISFGRFTGNPKDSKNLNDFIKKQRNAAKDIVKEVQGLLGYKDYDELLNQLGLMKPIVEVFIEVSLAFKDALDLRKKEISLFSFSDIEQFALKIVNKIGNTIKRKFDFIFVDEYQDTNNIQEAIIEKIAKARNRFLVGDLKQSIYRFRLSDPTIFSDKMELYSKETKRNRYLNLSENYRSSKHIIDYVNYVFENIMSKKLGECDYENDGKMKAGLKKKAFDRVELTLLEKDKDIGKEAHYVAQKIKTIMSEDPECDYKDICVLSRSINGIGKKIVNVFSEYSIPATFSGVNNFYDTVEVKVITNLLRLIDNNRQDIPLLGTLTSPLYNLNSSEIYQIKAEFPREETFYDSAVKYMEIDTPLSSKLREIFKDLTLWRSLAMEVSLPELIWDIYMKTGYLKFVGGLPNGRERQENLKILLKQAEVFEQTSMKGIFSFIQYIEKVEKSSEMVATTSVIDSNAVSIMSIHKSKGLEFKYVFLINIGKQFNKRSNVGKLLYHSKLGIAVDDIYLSDRHLKYSLSKKLVMEKNKEENLSEEMRLLYVAMTRAKEQLFLVGSVRDYHKEMQKASLNVFHLKKAKSYLDWVLAVYDPSVCELKTEDTLPKCVQMKIEPDQLETLTEEEKKEVIKRLNYKPYDAQNTFPKKMSVSEYLIGERKIEGLNKPQFISMNDETLSGADIGNAYHHFMYHLDFVVLRDGVTVDKLNNLAQRFVEDGKLTEVEKTLIDFEKIKNFFMTKLGQKLVNSKNVLKEKSFIYKLVDENIVLQGTIDCAFLDNGTWSIIDYKTGKATDAHKKQIDLYAKALSSLTAIPVKDKAVYYF